MTSRFEIEAALRRCYDAFNQRDVNAALSLMHPDVTWPNGWEGGWVNGHDAVRDYWQRQWAAIDPHVEPRGFSWDGETRVAVSVHQFVRDRQGNVIADQWVEHAYEIEDGLVRRMEIRLPV